MNILQTTVLGLLVIVLLGKMTGILKKGLIILIAVYACLFCN
jgi:hypothetical protein